MNGDNGKGRTLLHNKACECNYDFKSPKDPHGYSGSAPFGVLKMYLILTTSILTTMSGLGVTGVGTRFLLHAQLSRILQTGMQSSSHCPCSFVKARLGTS